MKIILAYKVEINPNNKQKTALLRHAGAARWAFNFGLRRKIESYETTGKFLSAMDLHKELVSLKKKSVEDGGVPWMYKVSKCAPQEALRNLDRAFDNFFRRCKQGAKRKGFPKFKSRKQSIGNFTLRGKIYVGSYHIQLPRLGIIKIKEKDYLPINGIKILGVTVSEKSSKWFVSLQVEQDKVVGKISDHIIGVDVGIKSLAVTSDGEVFENPKALKQSENRIRLLQKSVSRKKKRSNNRKKASQKLSRQHYRVSCIRKDAIHKATTAIAKQASVIVIESLNVAGMMKNHKLARAVSDSSMAEFLRQITYKVGWKGGKIIKADKFFPSSKTCSKCGFIKSDLTLSDRTFECSICGYSIDRDLNAAINLKQLAVSSTVTACRPESSGLLRQTKLLVGQESDIGFTAGRFE